jgi:hypothetical protein
MPFSRKFLAFINELNATMRTLTIAILLFGSLSLFGQETTYPSQVGDIQFDPAIDDIGFKVCNTENVIQYYNMGQGLQFNGEKKKILEHFYSHYKAGLFKGETGYITIRFIVNCEGSTGRYRVEEMDMNYQPKKFSKALRDTLLDLTKQLSGWTIAVYETQVFDYYQYLAFKIEDGQLKEILP